MKFHSNHEDLSFFEPEVERGFFVIHKPGLFFPENILAGALALSLGRSQRQQLEDDPSAFPLLNYFEEWGDEGEAITPTVTGANCFAYAVLGDLQTLQCPVNPGEAIIRATILPIELHAPTVETVTG